MSRRYEEKKPWQEKDETEYVMIRRRRWKRRGEETDRAEAEICNAAPEQSSKVT